jgi:hypothetical protein
MTSRLKKELLQLQLQRKNKNDAALVFEQAKVNLRKLWTAAYAEAGVPKGTRLFYSVRRCSGGSHPVMVTIATGCSRLVGFGSRLACRRPVKNDRLIASSAKI